mmetsp:Transcript_14804/g.22616  ORF Transcript_14804/g.22616 Transcript_14804/m.22616 type:complete len:93 (-) Transcript_14804:89-367(-)
MVQLVERAKTVYRSVANDCDVDFFPVILDDEAQTPLSAPASPRKYDYNTCKDISAHLVNAKALPLQCQKYPGLSKSIVRRQTDFEDRNEVLN